MNPLAHPPPPSPLRILRGAIALSALLVLGALVNPLAFRAVAAEPPARVLVINSDASVLRYTEALQAFKETLGLPITEFDLAKSSESLLRRALTAENPTVIYCIGGSAYQAALKLGGGKSIVLSSAINWERFKVDAKTTRVVANEMPAVSQLTLFRQFFPKLQRVGVVYTAGMNRQWFAQAVAAGKEVGIEVIGRTITRNSQLGGALSELTRKVDALWLMPDPDVLDGESSVKLYFARADAANLPVFAYSPAYAKFSPTLVIAPDTQTVGRQAAGLVQDFAGAPAVTPPGGSEVTLNLQRVRQYKLEFNREALDSVNHLIR